MAKRAPVRKPFVMITAALAVGCGARLDMGETPVADTGTTTTEDVRPETLPPGCPATKPVAGAACVGDVACDYGRCYAPYWTGGDFFHCSGGVWVGGGSSCNPPPPDPPCPATEPTSGTACERSPYAAGCQYKDSCPFNPTEAGTNDYACIGNRWQLTSPDYAVKCPMGEPISGTACQCAGHLPSTCEYGDCYGTPTTTASCVGNLWSVSHLSCNPPPPIDAGAGP